MNWRGVALSRIRLARHELLGGGHGERRRGTRARPLLAATLGLVLGTIVMLGLMVLFLQLEQDGVGAREASAVLALLLTATLVGLLAFDLHEVVSAMLLDSDLEFLRRAPIPGWALFLIKLLDALPRTSVLLVILGVPALIAYAAIFPVAWWCWLLAIPALGMLWAIALGLGVAVSVALLRVVPARTAREVLGLLSTFTLFALWLGNSFLLPRLALESGSPRALVEALGSSTLAMAWSPGAWAAGIMAAGSADAPVAALRGLALLAATAAAVLVAAGAVASRNLDRVQSRISGAPARSAGRADRATRFAARPDILDALLRRDLRLYLRDWTVLGDILVASVLWTLLPLVGLPILSTDAGAAPGIDRTLLARAMLLALTVALGYEIATRAIPFERGGMAWMRLAPVREQAWVAGRGVSTLTLALPIVAVATVAVTAAFALPLHAIGGTLALVMPALVTALATGMWTGAVHGNFAWTHPRAMLTLTGRAIATLLLLVQAAGWLVTAILIDQLPPWAYAVPFAFSILAAAGLLAATAQHLRRRQW